MLYKKARRYDDMIRLVTSFRKDLLHETHLHLAQQLEAEGSFKLAERHFVEATDWGAAVNMYRANELWDEAVRVAKQHGGVFPAHFTVGHFAGEAEALAARDPSAQELTLEDRERVLEEVDRLVADMGYSTLRKSNPIAEALSPYNARDYKALFKLSPRLESCRQS